MQIRVERIVDHADQTIGTENTQETRWYVAKPLFPVDNKFVPDGVRMR